MAEEEAKELFRAKKCRGAVRASITRLKRSIDKLEAKPELCRTDCLMIQHLVNKLEDWSAEFKKQHGVILDLMDDEEETTEREQAVYDEYDKKVTNFRFIFRSLHKGKNKPYLHPSL